MKKLLALFLTGLLLPASLTCCASAPEKKPTNTGTAVSLGTDGNSSTDSSLENSTDSDKTDSPSAPVKYETPQEVLEASPHLVGLTDQKNARLLVRDLAAEDWSDDASIVWEFNDPRAQSAAGMKFRNSAVFGGEVVLFCGPKGAGIISYQTKEVLYFTTNVGVNPHGVELLPDGTFIVGSTTDNKVSVFAAASGNVNPVQILTYENVHGVLWDPEYQVVWMAGRKNLSAFGVSGGPDAPRLTLVQGMVYTTGDWLHDLVPCYGNPQGLFVTCGTGIYFFDKEKERFTSTYPCSYYAAPIKTSPAMGCFSDHVMPILAVESGRTVHREWCMNEIIVLVPLSEKTVRKMIRVAPDDAYYKVRAWVPDYQ